MRFEQATIALVPRTTSNCIDLGVQFMGQHLREILALWFLVAAPASAVVYYLTRDMGADWRIACLITHFATIPLGALLMAGAAPSAFGERFVFQPIQRTSANYVWTGLIVLCGFSAAWHLLGYAFRDYISPTSAAIVDSKLFRVSLLITFALLLVSAGAIIFSRLGWRTNSGALSVMLRGLLVRAVVWIGPILVFFGNSWGWVLIGLVLWVFPGFWINVRQGFMFETFYLRTLDGQLVGRRTGQLVKELTGDFFMRGFSIALFCLIVWFVLLVTCEAGQLIMFGTSTFQGPLDDL